MLAKNLPIVENRNSLSFGREGDAVKKWAFFSAFILLFIMVQFAYLYHNASKPLSKAEAKAIKIAKEHANINKILDVDYFNGDEPYQVIQALDEHNEEIIIWVPENKPNSLIIEKASNGLTEKQVKEYAQSKFDIKKLQTIRLGMKYNIPVWEITFIDSKDRYSFYYLHFDGQTWIEDYRLKAL